MAALQLLLQAAVRILISLPAFLLYSGSSLNALWGPTNSSIALPEWIFLTVSILVLAFVCLAHKNRNTVLDADTFVFGALLVFDVFVTVPATFYYFYAHEWILTADACLDSYSVMFHLSAQVLALLFAVVYLTQWSTFVSDKVSQLFEFEPILEGFFSVVSLHITHVITLMPVFKLIELNLPIGVFSFLPSALTQYHRDTTDWTCAFLSSMVCVVALSLRPARALHATLVETDGLIFSLTLVLKMCVHPLLDRYPGVKPQLNTDWSSCIFSAVYLTLAYMILSRLYAYVEQGAEAEPFAIETESVEAPRRPSVSYPTDTVLPNVSTFSVPSERKHAPSQVKSPLDMAASGLADQINAALSAYSSASSLSDVVSSAPTTSTTPAGKKPRTPKRETPRIPNVILIKPKLKESEPPLESAPAYIPSLHRYASEESYTPEPVIPLVPPTLIHTASSSQSEEREEEEQEAKPPRRGRRAVADEEERPKRRPEGDSIVIEGVERPRRRDSSHAPVMTERSTRRNSLLTETHTQPPALPERRRRGGREEDHSQAAERTTSTTLERRASTRSSSSAAEPTATTRKSSRVRKPKSYDDE